ncbi:MAG: mechanosensitive ion channel [Arcobacter sp.]|uniref:mechanosensitive ion channel family protein n=1 Tax=Arcobacter sp. TaxID=1872629 RepID=UPI00258F07A4|nr:mechanosensitive ion channel domain-containing protein [Arcobacter sp.]MDD3007232.1 mechanosensitive ion channel [Arcobacter sp.]
MRIVFLILFLISNIFAIAIDKNWYEGTNENLEKLYQEQIKKADSLKANVSQEEKEQLDYQLLLLKKLSNFIKQDNQFILKEVTQIEDLDDYIKKIKEYLKTEIDFSNKKTEFEETNKKIEILDEQISKLTEKESFTTINSQLLYAYYILKNKENRQILDEYAKFQENFKKKLLTSLEILKISTKEDLTTKLTKLQNSFEQILKDEKRLLLALDKAQISENQSKITSLGNDITQLKNEKSKVIENIIYTKIEELLPSLKDKKSKYFDYSKNLQEFVESSNEDYTSLIELLKYLSREHLGVTKTTFADTKESFLDILKYTWQEINNPIIPIGEGISILAITKFLLIFIIGFSIATFYRKKISNGTVHYLKNTTIATRTMLANLGYYFLVAITFVFGLKSVGIDLSSLTILVGALSVGIGFGLQNIVSNFISGIILIFEKSIQVGHIIEIGTGLRGKVTQINMRSSVITTFDNIDIIIPNSTLIQNNVINLTFSDDIRRLNVPFGVAYGSNIDEVIKTILDSLRNSDLIYLRNLPEKAAKVRMTAMSASSIDFELLVWISENPDENGVGSSNMSDFLIFIYKTLQENNIEIPFPQMDVHLKRS